MHLEHLETPTHRGRCSLQLRRHPSPALENAPRDGGFSGFVRSSDSDGQIARFVVGLEIDREPVRLVGGVVSTVAFERACRLEVEECGRCVGLALCFDLRLDGCGERDLGCFRVDTRSELLRASSTVACECAGVSPVSTFTGVSVSSVNRTSSKVCVPRIASGSNSQS